MADREFDPRALCREGKLGSNEVFIVGRHSPIFRKFQEEMAMVYSLQLIGGQSIKAPPFNGKCLGTPLLRGN